MDGNLGVEMSGGHDAGARRGRRAALVAFLALPGAAAAQEVLSPAQRDAVTTILRDALRRDPSILRDALAALEEREAAERDSTQRRVLVAEADALFRDPADPFKGNPRGDVTLVEFFDVRCGFCRAFHPTVAELLRRDRGVRVVLKDIPILGPNSVLAARALLAAQRQDRYEALYDALLRLRTDTPEPVIQAEGRRVGLDWGRLRRDMDDAAITRRIEANLALARRLGITGTPTTVVGDAVIVGAVDLAELERLVRAARDRN